MNFTNEALLSQECYKVEDNVRCLSEMALYSRFEIWIWAG
jgi:hypothetical protein